MNNEIRKEIKARIRQFKKVKNDSFVRFANYLDNQFKTAEEKAAHFKEHLEKDFISTFEHSSLGYQAAASFKALVLITGIIQQELGRPEVDLQQMDMRIRKTIYRPIDVGMGPFAFSYLMAIAEIQQQFSYVKGEISAQ